MKAKCVAICIYLCLPVIVGVLGLHRYIYNMTQYTFTVSQDRLLRTKESNWEGKPVLCCCQQSQLFLLSLCRDVGNVVEAMYGDLPPPIMLIGHSMGGAIAVHTASSNLVPSLLGLCMIDVVEGKFSLY